MGPIPLDARRVGATRASFQVANGAEWMNGGSIPQDLKTQEKQVMGGEMMLPNVVLKEQSPR